MFTKAIVRLPGPDCGSGLTTANLGAPRYDLLCVQQARYIEVLQALGVAVHTLDPLPGYPDAYFVEDVAIITPEVAIITRPGAISRQGEEASMADVLSGYRPIVRIEAPGTVDGGDVLKMGTHYFIGQSDRTNQAGIVQLGTMLEHHGYTWSVIPVEGGLHLKSSVNAMGPGALILTAEFAQHEAFKGYPYFVLDESAAYAANSLWINGHLLIPAGYNIRDRLEKRGIDVIELDVSEIKKMDGGLTCLSLRLG